MVHSTMQPKDNVTSGIMATQVSCLHYSIHSGKANLIHCTVHAMIQIAPSTNPECIQVMHASTLKERKGSTTLV